MLLLSELIIGIQAAPKICDVGVHCDPGAYEPPKEHATHFHHYPNYVTHLKKNNFM